MCVGIDKDSKLFGYCGHIRTIIHTIVFGASSGKTEGMNGTPVPQQNWLPQSESTASNGARRGKQKSADQCVTQEQKPPDKRRFLRGTIFDMALEGLESIFESPLLEMVARIVAIGGAVADEAANVGEAASASKALKNTRFAEWVPKKSMLSALRLGLMAAALNSALTLGPMSDVASRNKVFQVSQTIALSNKKTEAQEMLEKQTLPGPEQYDTIRQQVRATIEQLRKDAGSDPIKITSLNFAIGNILDSEVNPLIKAMYPDGNNDQNYHAWLKELNVPLDFSEVYASSVMQDDDQLRSVTRGIRDWYSRPEVRAMRKLVHDGNTLFSWEVVFDASREGEHAYDESTVKDAAEHLLKQGNIEQVVTALESVKAPVPVEGLYKILLKYVPDSDFVREHGLAEKVPLSKDSGFRVLNE